MSATQPYCCSSGQACLLCDHLKSISFIGTSLNAPTLSGDSLDFMIETLKWLKPERKLECLEWRKQADHQNVPLIVQMLEITSTQCSKYLHFSVFGNLKRGHCSESTAYFVNINIVISIKLRL